MKPIRNTLALLATSFASLTATHAQTFTSAELHRCAIERRAVDAVI
jgi:hypothetical protein